MWEFLLEWCASLFGLTQRSRGGAKLFFVCVGLGVVGLVFIEAWGATASAIALILAILFAAIAGRQVVRARDGLWRTACLPLDDPHQRPPIVEEAHPRAATAACLQRLATALDDARRGRIEAAQSGVARVDRALLSMEEARLLDAVRALIALGVGDTRGAAQQALAALPTGSEELDASLGRATIADAWSHPERLRVIHATWEEAGVTLEQAGTLWRLQRLAKLRIDARLLEGVGAVEARALSAEARAIGDEDLAADLESRARESAYR